VKYSKQKWTSVLLYEWQHCYILQVAALLHTTSGSTATYYKWQHCYILQVAALLHTTSGCTATYYKWQHFYILQVAALLHTTSGSTATYYKWLHCYILQVAALLHTTSGCIATYYKWQHCYTLQVTELLHTTSGCTATHYKCVCCSQHFKFSLEYSFCDRDIDLVYVVTNSWVADDRLEGSTLYVYRPLMELPDGECDLERPRRCEDVLNMYFRGIFAMNKCGRTGLLVYIFKTSRQLIQ